MGPQASLSLHERLIERANKLGAKDNNDFPEVIHISLPIEDFISSPSKAKHVLVTIKRSLPYLWRSWQKSKNSDRLQYSPFVN